MVKTLSDFAQNISMESGNIIFISI